MARHGARRCGAWPSAFVKPEWDQYADLCRVGRSRAAWSSTRSGSGARSSTTSGQRNARYGAIASISVLVFLAILVAVNYLSFRQNKRWDLTKNQQYTLSDQTVKLLKNLDSPVKFLVFDKTDGFDRFRSALDEYRYQSPSKVAVEYIDADKKPVEARQYQVQSYGTVGRRVQGPHRAGELGGRTGADRRTREGAQSQ